MSLSESPHIYKEAAIESSDATIAAVICYMLDSGIEYLCLLPAPRDFEISGRVGGWHRRQPGACS